MMKDAGNVISTPSFTIPDDCIDGYTPFGKSCYKILTEQATWQNARQSCMDEAAELLDVHSAEENAAVQYMMYLGKVDTTWTGLKFNTDKQEYRWSSNWYVQYTQWGSGQPKREKGGGCVSYHVEDSKWYDTLCTTPLPPICKKTTAPPITPPPDKEGHCLNRDWLEIGGHCYKHCFGTSCNKKWLNQSAECTKFHPTAKLASIHDYATNDLLQKDMHRKNDGRYWIGMYRSLTDNLWRWLDGTPVQYTNFDDNEPNEDPSSGKDCVYTLISASDSGKWSSYSCGDVLGYVCKMDKLIPSTPTPVNGTCPGTLWEKHGDMCYLFRPDEFATWDRAQGFCVNEGGSTASLAMVSDYDTNYFLHFRMLSVTNLPSERSFWLGLTREDQDSPFMWIDGTNSSGRFEHWDAGQPTDKEGINCAQMNIQSSMWQNIKCGDFTGYACQTPVLSYGSTTTISDGLTTTIQDYGSTTPQATTTTEGYESTMTELATSTEGNGVVGGNGGLSGGAVTGIVIGVLLSLFL